jgi:ATP phosphoribosyltransferase regulatory subunit
MADALLPVGFYDLLHPKTHHQRQVMNTLTDQFCAYGYQLVEPPLMEFEDTLIYQNANDVSALEFRVLDPQAQKMMAIRADMTPQIARMVTSRLGQEPMPLRLTYAGKVLRVTSDHFHAERELTQAGIELIGEDAPTADIEVLSVALQSLKNLGINNLSIDFTIPSLIPSLLAEYDLNDNQYYDILTAIRKKNAEQVESLLAGEDASIITSLLVPHITLETLETLPLPEEAQILVEWFTIVIRLFQDTCPEFAVTIDPLGSQQFGYHTSLGFSIFSPDAKGELARGGRYLIETKDEDVLSATGVSMYINEIFRTAPQQQLPSRVFIPFGEEDVVTGLQKEGYITVMQLSESDVSDMEQAEQQQCQWIHKNGQLVAL